MSTSLLLRNPDAWRDLAEHPEAIETAVEEFLRMESSRTSSVDPAPRSRLASAA